MIASLPQKSVKQLLVAVLTLTILLPGCAVIRFNNGEVLPDPEEEFTFSLHGMTFGLFGEEETPAVYNRDKVTTERRSYNHAIFQIAELSNPLETTEACRGREWNQVTTEVTPFDALIGLLDNALLLNANAAGLDLWSPWSIEYSCRPVQ